MQFSSEEICDALHFYLENPLKQIDPEFHRLDTIPIQKSLLPGLFIEVKKVHSGSTGIGNFLGYQMDSEKKITGEIYGRQFDVRVNTEIWLNFQNKAAGLQTMQAVTDQLNDLFSSNTYTLREFGIFSISLRKQGEIKSNINNDLLPKGMRKTIRKTFHLALISEFSEIKTYETIKKINTASELA